MDDRARAADGLVSRWRCRLAFTGGDPDAVHRVCGWRRPSPDSGGSDGPDSFALGVPSL